MYVCIRVVGRVRRHLAGRAPSTQWQAPPTQTPYTLPHTPFYQIEDFEIARREHYDHKRESNAMYWMAFTLVMKRAKGESTRYLDFFNRKAAAEQTYVRCILEVRAWVDRYMPSYAS